MVFKALTTTYISKRKSHNTMSPIHEELEMLNETIRGEMPSCHSVFNALWGDLSFT